MSRALMSLLLLLAGMVSSVAAMENEDICLIRADPHALTYGKAKGTICFPCRYRVAKFQVPIESNGPNFGCSFEIFAFNVISQSGKYFAAGVEISLKVGAFNGPTFAREVLNFEINHAGAVSSDGSSVSWGDSAHMTRRSVTITCRFEVDQNYAIFTIPDCGTTVRFRPYRESDEPGVQVRMPGIAIISPKRAIFGSDSQRDQTRLLLPNAAECNRAIQAFQKCSVDQRSDAIRFCRKIMSSRKIIRCLRMDVLETFIFCLDAYCNNLSSCPHLVTMFRLAMRKDPIRCRAPRNLRRNINCTFMY
ncbi:hypothetical protein ACOMHN_047651 [Nucella lapillus]